MTPALRQLLLVAGSLHLAPLLLESWQAPRLPQLLVLPLLLVLALALALLLAVLAPHVQVMMQAR